MTTKYENGSGQKATSPSKNKMERQHQKGPTDSSNKRLWRCGNGQNKVEVNSTWSKNPTCVATEKERKKRRNFQFVVIYEFIPKNIIISIILFRLFHDFYECFNYSCAMIIIISCFNEQATENIRYFRNLLFWREWISLRFSLQLVILSYFHWK